MDELHRENFCCKSLFDKIWNFILMTRSWYLGCWVFEWLWLINSRVRIWRVWREFVLFNSFIIAHSHYMEMYQNIIIWDALFEPVKAELLHGHPYSVAEVFSNYFAIGFVNYNRIFISCFGRGEFLFFLWCHLLAFLFDTWWGSCLMNTASIF